MRTFMRATAAIAMLAAMAVANVPLRDYWGTEVTWHSARSLGCGGAASSGPAAVFGNPAFLGFVDRPVVELTYGASVAVEERTRVVYDQFENAIGEMALADNVHSHGVPGPACGLLPVGRLGLGAGIAPVRDFSYTFLKEYRDDFYVLTGEDRVNQTGMVYSAGIGLGFRPADVVSVGGRIGYLFGSRRLETVSWTGAETLQSVSAGDPNGVGWGAGVAVRPAAGLVFGADFTGSHTLADWSWSEGMNPVVVSRTYPWEARVGLEWRIPGALPAVATGEVVYEAWHGADTTLAGVLAARAGVEHLLFNFVRLRYGFGIAPLPFDPTIQAAQFAFGLGFDVGKARIDAGTMLGRDVIDASMFNEPLALGDTKTYENRSHFALSISRAF